MLYLASDHAGYQLKKYLARFIEKQLKQKVVDLGADSYHADDDFPDFAFLLAQKVATDPTNIGILICGSGQGMCIAANKVIGIRAMLGYSIDSAEWGRKHDHANILCLPSRVVSEEHAAAIVKKFLATPVDTTQKYVRRLEKITHFERAHTT